MHPHRFPVFSRSPFDVVAIAASMGGYAALREVLSALPANFPVPVVVLQHRGIEQSSEDRLVVLLAAHSKLRVRRIEDGDRMEAGNVYVVPPARHAVVKGARTLRLVEGPRVNFALPSADVLFHSVAKRYGHRGIGVVLTGKLYDGAEGADAIRNAGGRVLVQDLTTCVAPSMPAAVLKRRAADFALPLERIGPALVALTMVRGAEKLFQVGERARPELPGPLLS